ncbi:hypothetical protein AMK21_14310 [Streptomyces sp. CB00316]|uniref:DsrE family protein n=1 Tax=unclassified Streptomyces TaxID=2593676 RepID=UPI00093906A8|nr:MULTISPECIES: DsrE family protein [unclassified Streptomyces]MBT2380622.1 hypothetical protein [Streptomyces sp. ISL-111]MBT2430517.1 hypothetical protein [Streptomyces sp. ISL-112]MBT2461816.1 hypothetical protein [Streptomyces sp. ISL-63]OKJ19548.1 hypothetical protein AMK21_14310 [Streptomyces sp. CB00316]
MTATPQADPRERVLCVIDRAYRGAVEVQFFHPLYGLLDLHGQFAKVDLALRGATVTMAVEEDVYVPSVQLGSTLVDTLPDYRGSVRDLVAAGFEVFVEEDALASLGFTPDRLVAGVTPVGASELAARWPAYDQVWFV